MINKEFSSLLLLPGHQTPQFITALAYIINKTYLNNIRRCRPQFQFDFRHEMPSPAQILGSFFCSHSTYGCLLASCVCVVPCRQRPFDGLIPCSRCATNCVMRLIIAELITDGKRPKSRIQLWLQFSHKLVTCTRHRNFFF
jgi:hypothetical protein